MYKLADISRMGLDLLKRLSPDKLRIVADRFAPFMSRQQRAALEALKKYRHLTTALPPKYNMGNALQNAIKRATPPVETFSNRFSAISSPTNYQGYSHL